MLNYLSADRAVFLTKAENRLAEYGRLLLRADADGATDAGACWLEKALDLSVGLDVLARAGTADEARSARLIGRTVAYHELDSAGQLPFYAVAVAMGQPPVPGAGPVYWADLAGLPASSPALVAYVSSRLLAVPQPTAFTLTPTVAVGGLAAGVAFTGTSQQFWTKALVVYQAPAFLAFALDGLGSRTLEVGTAFADATRVFTWATSQPANVAANSVALLNVSAGAALASGVANSGTHGVLVPGLLLTNGETRRYRVSARDTQGAAFSADLVLSGAHRLYFGPGLAVDRPQALLLGGTQLTSEGNSATLLTGGTATQFTILLPPGRTLSSVTDLDNLSANLTAAYVAQPPIDVADAGGAPVAGYTRYVLTAATPYQRAARHLFQFS